MKCDCVNDKEVTIVASCTGEPGTAIKRLRHAWKIAVYTLPLFSPVLTDTATHRHKASQACSQNSRVRSSTLLLSRDRQSFTQLHTGALSECGLTIRPLADCPRTGWLSDTGSAVMEATKVTSLSFTKFYFFSLKYVCFAVK